MGDKEKQFRKKVLAALNRKQLGRRTRDVEGASGRSHAAADATLIRAVVSRLQFEPELGRLLELSGGHGQRGPDEAAVPKPADV